MRILIVGDDRCSTGQIERSTREILGRRVSSVKTLDSLEEARDHLQKTPIDLLLIDLDAQKGDGFSLLDNAIADSFQTVGFSSTPTHALRAFELGLAGFVLKPIDERALGRTIHRLFDTARRADYASRYLSVRRRGRIRLIPIEEVRYARGAGPYSELVMRDGSTELHNKSLDALQAQLPGLFERIHRSYIVNMGAVTSFLAHEGSRYEAELDCGTKLPVGRTRFRRIRERLR